MQKLIILLLVVLTVLCVCVACKNEVEKSNNEGLSYGIFTVDASQAGNDWIWFTMLYGMLYNISGDTNSMVINGHQLFKDTGLTDPCRPYDEVIAGNYYYPITN